MAILSLLASWFTPTTLFLLLNLMIGTIVISSRFGSGSRKPSESDHSPIPSPLVRAPSLIDRFKSINLNLYKFPNPAEAEVFDDSGLDPNANRLVRTPSLIDRVKSINLSYFKFPKYNPEHDYAQTGQAAYVNPPDPTRLEPLESTNSSRFKISDYIPENDYPEPCEADCPETSEPTRLVRAPSLLERVKSISFSSFYRSEQPNPETVFDQSAKAANTNPVSGPNKENKPKRSKSETKKPASSSSSKMKKLASEKEPRRSGDTENEAAEAVEMRRPATSRFERSTSFGDGEQSVDAKAADFINKFKQQLKLQRLDSILRYK